MDSVHSCQCGSVRLLSVLTLNCMYMVQHSLQMFQFKIYPDKKLHMAQTVCEREMEWDDRKKCKWNWMERNLQNCGQL